MANRKAIQYENRLIAFVDLLGFKQAVNNSVNHQVIAQKIMATDWLQVLIMVKKLHFFPTVL